ncbi:hypothetical protein HDE_00779 [Halotydeus destructor]|nr:hypothetical protein HDE_00779 [Halotydeus destructor]
MSQFCSVAAFLFLVASVSSNAERLPINWEAASGLTTHDIRQSKASIIAKLDHIKVSFQDWKRGEVDGLFFALDTKKAEVAVNHEILQAAAKVTAFCSNMQELGLLSEGDAAQLQADLLAAVEGPHETVLEALASMSNTLTMENHSERLEDSEKQVESVVEKTKKTILDIVDKVYWSVDGILSTKFRP